jgi:hypothetical protein
LRFFRLGVLAFQVSERDVQRLVAETDSDGVHRNPFFMQCIGIGLAEAMQLGGLDTSLLGKSL